MPIQKFSAMDPGGSWQDDAIDARDRWNTQRADQWTQYNTNLANQRSQDDWRKEVALKQLGLTREMGLWGREDAATARQLEADRWGKQFDYMSRRDKLMDERSAAREAAEGNRWQQGFDLQKSGIEAERAYRAQDMAERQAEREAAAPLRKMHAELAQAELADRQRRQMAMQQAASGAAYTPTTDTGREAYQQTMATVGDPLQAGFAAKGAERARAAQSVEAAKAQLEAMMQDFSAKDTSIVGWDPSPQESSAILKQAAALKALMAQAGMQPTEIDAAIAQIARSSMTSKGRTDWNAGPTEEVLSQLGATYR